MAKLILLRHGESIWNKNNLFTGWVDIPLSVKGIEEAFKAGERMSHIVFHKIYMSTLIRAQLTTMLAMSKTMTGKIPCVIHEPSSKHFQMSKVYDPQAEVNLIPVYINEALNERMYGQLQGLNKSATLQKYGEEQFKHWRRSYKGQPPSGESLEMTAQRAIPFFKNNILPRLYAGDNVLVSAHGNSLRAIVMFLDALSEDQVVALEIPTGEPICYHIEESQGWSRQNLDECNKEFKLNI